MPRPADSSCSAGQPAARDDAGADGPRGGEESDEEYAANGVARREFRRLQRGDCGAAGAVYVLLRGSSQASMLTTLVTSSTVV